MENQPATPLEYAPRKNRSSRNRIIRRILQLIFAIALAGWIYHQHADLSLRARRLYWSFRCMHHVTPPGTVLIEYDPIKAAQLLATNPDYVAEGTQWNLIPIAAVKQKLSLATKSLSAAAYWPVDWRSYLAVDWTASPYLSGVAITFLGERISPGGHRRLVAIPSFVINAFAVSFDLQCDSMVLQPPTMFGSAQNTIARAYAYSGRYAPAILSPAVADPSDASHISVGFVTPQSKPPRHGTIDIYLRDDDTLDCRIRDPATPRVCETLTTPVKPRPAVASRLHFDVQCSMLDVRCSSLESRTLKIER